jgi:hypothetical protein
MLEVGESGDVIGYCERLQVSEVPDLIAPPFRSIGARRMWAMASSVCAIALLTSSLRLRSAADRSSAVLLV